MIAYTSSTHRMYREWMLPIAPDPAVQKELDAEARCNPYSAAMLIGDLSARDRTRRSCASIWRITTGTGRAK